MMAFKNLLHGYTTILLIFLLAILIEEHHSVRITSVNIPTHFTLDDDSPEKLILDCEYDIDDNETSLVVKWFKDNQAIYQWIKGGAARAYPKMRNKIDEEYIISDDPWQSHRAVALLNPSLDLSGDYKCVVQTAQSADSKISHLEILDMSNVTLKVDTEERDSDTLVSCTVNNIKPKPTLELRLNKDEEIEIDNENVFNNTDGFFQVTVSGNVSNDKIDSESEFGCLLSFDGTNYTKWHFEIHSGNSNNKLPFKYSLLSSILVLVISTCLRDII